MKLFYATWFALLLNLPFYQLHAQGLDNAGIGATTVSAAYSTRLLRTAYNGFCLRVRRSLDNAEANVAFNASSKRISANSAVTIAAAGSSGLSVGATMSFSAFYNGTSCFVTTWYDQSGNGRDAVQNTNNSQPRIVNAGIMDALNTWPALTFQNTSQLMTTAASMTVQTINAVRAAPNTSWQTLVAVPANTDFSIRANSNLYNLSPNGNDWFISTGPPYQFWVNGVQSPAFNATTVHTISANSNTPVSGTISISTTFLGRGMNSGAAVSEIILIPASLSTLNRQALESNQNTYFVSSTLPLYLKSFSGRHVNAINELTWQTTGESNTKQFIIERKPNNGIFTAIARVPAKGRGNAHYAFNDDNAPAGTAYYRLKMEDTDGRFTFSSIVTLSIDQAHAVSKAYPNPVNDKVFIDIHDNKLLHTQARLMDIHGKIISVFSINAYKQPVNLAGQPAGAYLILLKSGEVLTITKK